MLKITYVLESGPPRLIFEGDPSSASLEHAFDSVISEPEFMAGKGLLIDTTLTNTNYSADEIQYLANHIAQKRDAFGSRLALVVSPDKPVQYGLARMFSAYADNRDLPVGVFTNPDEALRWLRA